MTCCDASCSFSSPPTKTFILKSCVCPPLQEPSPLQSAEFTTSLSIPTPTGKIPDFYFCIRTARLLLAPQSIQLPPTSLITAPTGWYCSSRKEIRLLCTWKPGHGSGQTVIAIFVLLLVFCCTVCPAMHQKPLCNFTGAVSMPQGCIYLWLLWI